MMLVGWGILAVPTGIVTSEFARQRAADEVDGGAAKGGTPLVDALRQPANERACARCGVGDHATDAAFRRCCGTKLD